MLEKILLALMITLCLNLFLGAKLPSSTNATAITGMDIAANLSLTGKWLTSHGDLPQYESPLHGI